MEGDLRRYRIHLLECISIHSLRMEGDPIVPPSLLLFQDFNPLPPYGGRLNDYILKEPLSEFQSTPSVWRETCNAFKYLWRHDISIHSLRMEGDGLLDFSKWLTVHFNPLPPYGGRLINRYSTIF